MIETSFTVRFLTDEYDEGKELLEEIRRLIKDSYFRYEIVDIEQDEV